MKKWIADYPTDLEIVPQNPCIICVYWMVYLIIEISIERSIIHIFDNIHLINDVFVIIAMYEYSDVIMTSARCNYINVHSWPFSAYVVYIYSTITCVHMSVCIVV